MLSILILFISISPAISLIGYECGPRTVNVTTISLLDVAPCDIPTETINVSKQYVQLLQINEYTETPVIQCKIEIHRTIYYCGMYSHISIVRNGESEYISEIDHETCRDAHRVGTLKYGIHAIHGLRVNDTVTHGLTFAGFLNSDGVCNGGNYADPYGSWESVVVQGTIKITLTAYTAKITLNTDQIHLRSGVTCPLSTSTCLDLEGGQTFWRSLPADQCRFNQYGVLYEGEANKMIDYQTNEQQTVYSVVTQGITFALTAKGKESVCGYTITRTEHPKLVIFETTRGNTFATNRKVSVSNLDLFAYMNSKFVYVEKYIRTQMKQLYLDVITQKCELERQTLKNSLMIATQAPDEFAYYLMKGAGYMAVIAGEVVHIVKCIPVNVRVEHGNDCYAELQVSHKNSTYFLSPRTHILKTKGTTISCNALLPSYYFVGESWYKILPRPTEALPPAEMKPATKATWKYMSPADLATTGIYTEKDLQDLQDRIMFPVEQSALLNDVAREIHGHPVTENQGTLNKLINEDALTTIVQSFWSRLWIDFKSFGSTSSGFIAIAIMLVIAKALFDLVIRGYALHSIYGWSVHLFAAVFGSLAHALIYTKRTATRPRENATDLESGIPLATISNNPPQETEKPSTHFLSLKG